MVFFGNGSGFFITSDGHFITNFHVVREADDVRVIVSNEGFQARVVNRDPSNDLALLKVEGSGFVSVRSQSCPRRPLAASEQSDCSRRCKGPKLSGRSRQGAPDRNTQKMPLPSARRAQPQVRFRGEVDVNRHARLAGSVENDPKLL
jgi:hypothetical protein